MSLALVSRHFHELASARLYRNLRFYVADISDLNFDPQIARLIGCFETLAASSHDYARYIKSIQLGVPGPEDRNWRSAGDNAVSGRFLNTLLLLTLKRAKALEAFKYVDIHCVSVPVNCD